MLALAVPALGGEIDRHTHYEILGQVAAGEEVTLAVHRAVAAPAQLAAWVDLDGDGRWQESERVVDGAFLDQGIELLPFTLDAGLEPGVALRVRLVLTAGEERAEAVAVLRPEGLVECEWDDRFFLSSLDGPVHAVTTWDDGTGEALYAGGDFLYAAGQRVNHIARWDGTSWSPLPGGDEPGVSGPVSALAVWDDGAGSALYLAGRFAEAGGPAGGNGVLVVNIAKWDGSQYSSLTDSNGTGITFAPGAPPPDFGANALAVYDDGDGSALYVGGLFTRAGFQPVHHVARWDGTDWSPVAGPGGEGVDGDFGEVWVEALEVYDDGGGAALYVGGHFNSAGGSTASAVARWDGTDWTGLAGPSGDGVGGPDPLVEALAVFDDGGGAELYAAGDFTTAGGVATGNLARWDGGGWAALAGSAANGAAAPVRSLTVWDDGGGAALYAGGDFKTIGGTSASRVARWDGATWSALAGGGSDGVDGPVLALAAYDDGSGSALYAAGELHATGEVAANGIARWDGAAWSPLDQGGEGFSGPVHALAVYDDGTGPALYAGGEFISAGDILANNIARWDGTGWTPLAGPSGTGVGGGVFALAVYDDGDGAALYAGGTFFTAGGVAARRMARWDGTDWSPLAGSSGEGANASVRALAVYDDGTGPVLYAGGTFTEAGGLMVNRVASWDGTEWAPLTGSSGTGTDGPVLALRPFDSGAGSRLMIAGDFLLAGGQISIDAAEWDGSGWHNPSLRTNNRIWGLGEWDDGTGDALFIAGSFQEIRSVDVDFSGRWDGAQVEPLFGTLNNLGLDAESRVLIPWDDGAGEALYFAGQFEQADGEVVNRVARWDGLDWTPLPGPQGTGIPTVDGLAYFDTRGEALAAFDDGSGPALHVGGPFLESAAGASRGFARYSCILTDGSLFADGFESGDLTAWSTAVGVAP